MRALLIAVMALTAAAPLFAQDEPAPIEPGPDVPAVPSPDGADGDKKKDKAGPKPDAKVERMDLGLGVPVAQCCAGTMVAWLPIPCVTSAASGYVVTAAGNATSPRDNAALGPMIAAVVTDVVVIGLIAGGYGLAFAGAATGTTEGVVAGTLGGVVIVMGAFFARPFAVAGISTLTWQLQADEHGGDAWLPPPFFAPEPDELAHGGMAAR